MADTVSEHVHESPDDSEVLPHQPPCCPGASGELSDRCTQI